MRNEIRLSIRVADYEGSVANYLIVVDLEKNTITKEECVSHQGLTVPYLKLETMAVEMTGDFLNEKLKFDPEEFSTYIFG